MELSQRVSLGRNCGVALLTPDELKAYRQNANYSRIAFHKRLRDAIREFEIGRVFVYDKTAQILLEIYDFPVGS